MGHIEYSTDVATPVDVAFGYVDNYAFASDRARYSATGGLSGTRAVDFRPLGRGMSEIGVEIAYDAPGGIAAKAGDTLVDAFVNTAIRCSEDQLRREIQDLHGPDVVGRTA